VSTDAAIPTAQQDALSLIPLLKEYSKKLNQLCDRLLDALIHLKEGRRSVFRVEHRRVADAVKFMEKPVLGFTRLASQLIEHTKLDMLLEAELKLRLDETEQAFLTAQRLLNEFPVDK
jgi:hypothetical protein